MHRRLKARRALLAAVGVVIIGGGLGGLMAYAFAPRIPAAAPTDVRAPAQPAAGSPLHRATPLARQSRERAALRRQARRKAERAAARARRRETRSIPPSAPSTVTEVQPATEDEPQAPPPEPAPAPEPVPVPEPTPTPPAAEPQPTQPAEQPEPDTPPPSAGTFDDSG